MEQELKEIQLTPNFPMEKSSPTISPQAKNCQGKSEDYLTQHDIQPDIISQSLIVR